VAGPFHSDTGIWHLAWGQGEPSFHSALAQPLLQSISLRAAQCAETASASPLWDMGQAPSKALSADNPSYRWGSRGMGPDVTARRLETRE
jgi:hypothetical protein